MMYTIFLFFVCVYGSNVGTFTFYVAEDIECKVHYPAQDSVPQNKYHSILTDWIQPHEIGGVITEQRLSYHRAMGTETTFYRFSGLKPAILSQRLPLIVSFGSYYRIASEDWAKHGFIVLSLVVYSGNIVRESTLCLDKLLYFNSLKRHALSGTINEGAIMTLGYHYTARTAFCLVGSAGCPDVPHASLHMRDMRFIGTVLVDESVFTPISVVKDELVTDRWILHVGSICHSSPMVRCIEESSRNDIPLIKKEIEILMRAAYAVVVYQHPQCALLYIGDTPNFMLHHS